MTFEKHLCSASQRLGILRKFWLVFHNRSLLGRWFRGIVMPVLQYSFAVWCSPADTFFIIIIWSPLCKAGREWEHSISLKTSTRKTNPWKEEEDKIVRDKKERADHANRKALALFLKPPIPHLKHGVTKIVPKIHREGHKGSAILRSPTTRKGERVPMSNQSTTSSTHGTYGKGNAPRKDALAYS